MGVFVEENDPLVIEYLLQKIRDLTYENAVLSARVASSVASEAEVTVIGGDFGEVPSS